MDTRCTPQRIGRADLADQVPDLLGDRRPPWTASGFPAPECPEATPVPPHNRIRIDDGYGLEDTRPETLKPDEQEPI